MSFWEVFSSLCEKNKKTPNSVCAELKLSNATATHWKNGTVPRGTTLQKVADYFGVTTDYLLGNTDQKEKPSSEDEGGDDCVVVFRNGQKITRHYDKEQLDLISNLLDQLDKNQSR